MFFDERIYAAKGKAFRNTMFFSCALLFVYTVLHRIYLYCTTNDPQFISTLFETAVLAANLVILAIGELRFAFSEKDEMTEFRKNGFYAKGFSVFLCVVAGLYCIVAPLIPIALRYPDLPINTPLGLTLIPCWLFLLWQFKRSDVTLNSEFIEEKKEEYRKRVLRNLHKFSGICFLFMLCGIFVLYEYLKMTQESFLFSAAYLFTVLIAGILSWGSISVEYLIFSYAERSSERAKAEGKFSHAVRLFLWIGIAVRALSLISNGLVMHLDPYSLTRFTMADLINLANAVADGVFYFDTLFLLYLYSELRVLKDKKLNTAFSGMFWTGIVSSLLPDFISILQDIVHCRLGSFVLTSEQAHFFNSVNYALSMIRAHCSALLAVLSVVFLCIAVAAASRHGIIRKRFIALFLLSFLVSCFSVTSAVLYIILASIPLALRILIAVLLCRTMRKAEEARLLNVGEENDLIPRGTDAE